ncbi:uncharacterized protein LOC108162258 [Drosophila miranda]|uniref:uncharacterized protein LOC108162258 n=1 Tax=Drosophila miranda TaxID=7229 RepID=UPI0007E74581|nr:uncharacterized protein LOC108162258 [Drosophila miranda]
MAATVSHSSSHGYGQEPLFVSRATIQLQLRSPAAPGPAAPPRIYEWHTQVATPPTPTASPSPTPEAAETAAKCIKQAESAAHAATPKRYTPPRIMGTEAKRKNLPQTLGNFFEVERYESGWNRVTKRDF